MSVNKACDNCGASWPIYRLSSVLLDARVAQLCPKCLASESERIAIPYAPRPDQGAIQPSTSRDVW